MPQRRPRISGEAIRLFVLIEEIEASGAGELWEEASGRRREMHDAENALARLLELGPHRFSPTQADAPEPPEWLHSGDHADWRDSYRLRLKLLKAAQALAPSRVNVRFTPRSRHTHRRHRCLLSADCVDKLSE